MMFRGLLSVPFIALIFRDLYLHGNSQTAIDISGLFKRRPVAYYFVLFAMILPVWSIIPVSYSYVIYTLYQFLVTSNSPTFQSPLRFVLFVYAVIEVLFSIEHHNRIHRLQRHVVAPKVNPDEMRALFETCHASMDPVEFVREFPKWFLDAPIHRIRRGNVSEWLCWAFCSKFLEDADESEIRMIDDMVNVLQARSGLSFPPGRDPTVRSCRLTLDRVEGMSRPLAFYLATSAMGLAMNMLLRVWGFKHHNSGHISYWIYTPPTMTAKPLVFVHGIGIGLAAYVNFVYSLYQLSRKTNAPLILPVLSHISMGLFQSEFPGRAATVQGILSIFPRHGIDPVGGTWIGHSLGSVVVGWVCMERLEVVGRLALVDPVCFRLWEADVCYNFVYKTPTSGEDLMMWYFVAREVGVSAALGRGFWWFQNVLFPSSLPPLSKTHVYLGSNDRVVNPRRVIEYLEKNDVPTTCFRGLGHAGVLVVSATARAEVLAFIEGRDTRFYVD